MRLWTSKTTKTNGTIKKAGCAPTQTGFLEGLTKTTPSLRTQYYQKISVCARIAFCLFVTQANPTGTLELFNCEII